MCKEKKVWKEIYTKTINAFIQPEPQHTVQFLSDFLAVPIEIRLVLAKYVQI